MQTHKFSIILLTFLYSYLYAIDVGVSNKGFEFGFFGNQHFKVINAYDGTYSYDQDQEFMARSRLLFQWYSLKHTVFSVNFSSGIYAYYNSFQAPSELFLGYTKDNKQSKWGLGINIIVIEPELRMNDYLSFYLRNYLLTYNLQPTRFITAGTYELSEKINYQVANSTCIGIRFCIKSKKQKSI